MEIKSPKADKYWQVTDRCEESKDGLINQLQRAGYELKASANKTQLSQLRQRVRLGRLCYDKFSRADLMGFAVARGVVDAKKNPTKRWLADKLMEADDQRTFSKMEDLPPELRKIIHEFYISEFADDCTSLEEPTQPPLARTCTLMRNEVLPIFYNKCTFVIRYETMPTGPTRKARFRLAPMSYIFLSSLAPDCLGDIRKVDLCFANKVYVGDWFVCWADINLRRRMLNFEFTVGTSKTEEQEAKIEKELERAVRRILRRDDGGKLMMQDFFNLGSAAERGFNYQNALEEI